METVLTNWIELCKERWEERGMWGINDHPSIPTTSPSLQEQLLVFLSTCTPCERVKECSSFTMDCYCHHCQANIFITSSLVENNAIYCPYCHSSVQGVITVVSGTGEECESYPFLTPVEICHQLDNWKHQMVDGGEESTENMLNSLFVNCQGIASLLIPAIPFSRLNVRETAIDWIPTPLLACIFQLIGIAREEMGNDHNPLNSYLQVKDALADRILQLRGINLIPSIEANPIVIPEKDRLNPAIQQYTENVALALLSCSPDRELEYVIEKSKNTMNTMNTMNYCIYKYRLLPVNKDSIGIMSEVVNYFWQDDIMNACKLYLFCRGGDIHPGFCK